ncbi:unnamed protein product [Prorocentrum cordatum]|uniref:SREBP regulating gene protein n=1 Tax=Prorocentrum cordatum TaxID=2364126 RepID=A0ABN9TRL9_9DINO|nr:unnamed protein product [Polarella glacialis]
MPGRSVPAQVGGAVSVPSFGSSPFGSSVRSGQNASFDAPRAPGPMALAGLLGLALLLRGVPASQEAESCEAAGGCDEAGLAQLRASLATKGGDSDQEEGGCMSNGKLCTADDKCCSGFCDHSVPDKPIGRLREIDLVQDVGQCP